MKFGRAPAIKANRFDGFIGSVSIVCLTQKCVGRTSTAVFADEQFADQFFTCLRSVRFQTAEYLPDSPWKNPISMAQWLSPA